MRILAVSLLILYSTVATAQKYGGSAYAYVVDDEGNKRCITVAASCSYFDVAKAKSYLNSKLTTTKNVYEEFSSKIYYDIDSCFSSSKYKFFGSESAIVEDKEGKKRAINVTASCSYFDKPSVKSYLVSKIGTTKSVYERVISPIEFETDICDK